MPDAHSHDFRRFRVRGDMWLEGIGNRDRDNTVEGNSVVALRCFQHVRIAIGENHQRITGL